MNANYNWSHSAADNVNIFPELGGKTSSDSNSVQVGYTVGYHKITSISNSNWNRSSSQTTNFFTNGRILRGQLGIDVPSGESTGATPINYGLPNVQFNDIVGLSEQQPNFFVAQTISVSETLSWIHGKHNVRFGGDYRRVHRELSRRLECDGEFYVFGVVYRRCGGRCDDGFAIRGFSVGLSAGDDAGLGDEQELSAGQRV